MSTEVYRRVGRGGAGNFFSKKEIEVASKKPEDLEAQTPSSPPHAAPATHSVPAYQRGGRGGAGNFSDPATAADHQQEVEDFEKTKAAVKASLSKPKTGLSGRGGVGNWSDANASEEAQSQEEQKKVEDIEMKVLHDVETGLAMPQRTYHQHEREME